jgi:hypothetical protein
VKCSWKKSLPVISGMLTCFMQKIESILMGLVYGDALGSLFEGMSRGHVDSHFHTLTGFPDTFDALKGHYDRWRKPGLYGGLTQLTLLASIFGCERPGDSLRLADFIVGKGRVVDATAGIYRAPGRFLEEYLVTLFRGGSKVLTGLDHLSATVIPVAMGGFLPLSVYAPPSPVDLIAYARAMGADIFGSIGSALFSLILHHGMSGDAADEGENIVMVSAIEAERLEEDISSRQPELFKKGVNPDRAVEAARIFVEIFHDLGAVKDTGEAERVIVKHLSGMIESPVTRATIDHPCAILPFAAAIVSFGDASSLYQAVRFGGNTTVLCAMTGMYAGAFYDGGFPPEIEEGLINKKGIVDIISRIAKGEADMGDAEDFFDREIPLNVKEIDERNARLRHVKIPEKKKRTSNGRESSLTRHVVESWTKTDKARWRKERQTQGENDEE